MNNLKHVYAIDAARMSASVSSFLSLSKKRYSRQTSFIVQVFFSFVTSVTIWCSFHLIISYVLCLIETWFIFVMLYANQLIKSIVIYSWDSGAFRSTYVYLLQCKKTICWIFELNISIKSVSKIFKPNIMYIFCFFLYMLNVAISI